MRALVLAVSLALCACTSQQYAQFNQRINDSISRTTEPPPPPEWKSETTTDYVPAPAPAPIPEYRVPEKVVQTLTFTPKPQPKQPTAKGDQLVDGAIVCPSLDATMWLYNKIGAVKVARNYMPPQNRQMVILQDGYDPWEEPKPAEYRCQFVPAGTPMNVKLEGGIPVVWGKMKDGRPFAGVTNPMMVDY